MFFCKNIVCILHTKLCIECHPYILLSCIKPYARFGQPLDLTKLCLSAVSNNAKKDN